MVHTYSMSPLCEFHTSLNLDFTRKKYTMKNIATQGPKLVFEHLRPTLYLGPNWGPTQSLSISISRIVWFLQLGPKGFILELDPNSHLSYVASYVGLFWRQSLNNWVKVSPSLNLDLGSNRASPSDWGLELGVNRATCPHNMCKAGLSMRYITNYNFKLSCIPWCTPSSMRFLHTHFQNLQLI